MQCSAPADLPVAPGCVPPSPSHTACSSAAAAAWGRLWQERRTPRAERAVRLGGQQVLRCGCKPRWMAFSPGRLSSCYGYACRVMMREPHSWHSSHSSSPSSPAWAHPVFCCAPHAEKEACMYARATAKGEAVPLTRHSQKRHDCTQARSGRVRVAGRPCGQWQRGYRTGTEKVSSRAPAQARGRWHRVGGAHGGGSGDGASLSTRAAAVASLTAELRPGLPGAAAPPAASKPTASPSKQQAMRVATACAEPRSSMLTALRLMSRGFKARERFIGEGE